MSLYVLPENQELIWKTISKVPQFQQMNNQNNEKHLWFQNIIRKFYEQTTPSINVNELRELNKKTIQYMVSDLKQQFQPVNNSFSYSTNEFSNVFHQQPMSMETNKQETRNSILEKKQTILSDQFEEKQKEYQSFLQKPVTNEIDFKENVQEDKPIENMDELLQKQLKEREYDVQNIITQKETENTDELLEINAIDLEEKQGSKSVTWADEYKTLNKSTQSVSSLVFQEQFEQFKSYVEEQFTEIKQEIATLKINQNDPHLETNIKQRMKSVISKLQHYDNKEEFASAV